MQRYYSTSHIVVLAPFKPGRLHHSKQGILIGMLAD